MNRKLLPLVMVAVGLAGCTPDFATQNSHTLFMEIARITGAPGSDNLDEGDVLFSDVSTVVNDDAVVTVNVFRKNPTIDSTSALEHVSLESYEVRFFRSDGRNTEGVDVPYRITGPLSGRFHTPTETGEVELDVVINVVRHQAKLEPPLRNLVGGIDGTLPTIHGAGVLTTIAEITVYGRSLDGDTLTAKGRLQVSFADFADN